MARAYGIRATMKGAFEDTYGTAPTTGWRSLPFVSSSLGSQQGLIEDDLVGTGRNAEAPIQDVINADGDVVAPADLRNLGWWLKLLLGTPTSTQKDAPDDGFYEHVYESGEDELPSASIEIGHPQVPTFFVNSGVRCDQMQVQLQRSGQANITFQMIAQGEDRETTTVEASPDTYDLRRFNQFQGSIKSDGSTLGNVTSASVTFNNGIERVETIRDDGKIDGADPTVARMTGSITVRFANTDLLAKAEGFEAVELEFGYRIDDNRRLQIVGHEIYLPKPKQQVSGPGGIEATYEFQAAKDENGDLMTITLTNDIEDYA